MTKINSSRNLMIALVCTLAALSLPVACTRRSPKSSEKPKLPAAAYRGNVNEPTGSIPSDPQHYDDLLAKLESDRVKLASRYHQATSRLIGCGLWLKLVKP